MSKGDPKQEMLDALEYSNSANPQVYTLKSIQTGLVHIEKRIDSIDNELKRFLDQFHNDVNTGRKGLGSMILEHDSKIKELHEILLLQAETAKNQKIDERVRLVETKVSELEVTNRIFSANTKQWVLIALSLAGIANFFIQLYFKYK